MYYTYSISKEHKVFPYKWTLIVGFNITFVKTGIAFKPVINYPTFSTMGRKHVKLRS